MLPHAHASQEPPSSIGGRAPRAIRLLTLAACGLLALASARPADAQFGALKKLKNKVTGTPDSASVIADSVKKDSAKVAATAPADTTKGGQSIFSRAKNAASKASDKFEQTTGISAKDAALAASGAGVANLVMKKTGVADATNIGNIGMNAIGKSASAAASAAKTPSVADLSKLGMPGMPAIPGMSAISPSVTGARVPAVIGGTAETAAVLEFQQELMDVAMKASTGDANARARLDAWQALLLKYQPEMMRLSTTAAAQPDTPRKLMELQLALMSEWRGKRVPKLVKP